MSIEVLKDIQEEFKELGILYKEFVERRTEEERKTTGEKYEMAAEKRVNESLGLN